MRIRHLLCLIPFTLAPGLTAPAAADEEPAAPAERAADASLPPAPLRPWLVTRHPVGDSVSHVIDVAGSPGYRVGAVACWTLERMIYRDAPLRMRVQMPDPAGEGATAQPSAE